jgi:hypothetical protein
MNYDLLNDNLVSDSLLLKLEQTKDLIVSWHFFEIISSSININNIDKITITDKYKTKLIHFIHYDKNIVKNYKRDKKIPLSKEYFKTIGTTLLIDEKLNIHNFKTFPIFSFKNLVIIGILLINTNINTNINTTMKNNILYKKIFLVDNDKTLTRFNNINIIKGIINSHINKEYLGDNITLITKCESILNENLNINCSLVYLLNNIQKYSWIFEFKIYLK